MKSVWLEQVGDRWAVSLSLTAGVVGLLLTGQNVGQAGLLLRLVQDVVPIGSEEGAAVKVDCSGYVTIQDTWIQF